MIDGDVTVRRKGEDQDRVLEVLIPIEGNTRAVAADTVLQVTAVVTVALTLVQRDETGRGKGDVSVLGVVHRLIESAEKRVITRPREGKMIKVARKEMGKGISKKIKRTKIIKATNLFLSKKKSQNYL